MKPVDWKKWFSGLLHWKGWGAFAGFCGKAWKRTAGWHGWKVLFGMPVGLVIVLCVICGVGLVWVFSRGYEQSVPSFFLYGVSAYAMTALCVQLPRGIQAGKTWIACHPKILAMLENKELKFRWGLYFEQLVNFSYGIFKIVSGLALGSAWIGCDGIYNMAQALIQLFQILRRKKPGTLVEQWRSYRFCGVLMLLMHLTMTGIVFQMVNWNRAEEQGEILVIATAAFAFYKVINSFVDLAKDRRHEHPVDSSVRMLELSQAVFAIFSLQASMFHTFGTGERWEHWLNLGTGSAVCLTVVSMGIYMIRRGSREIRIRQESGNGEA